MSKTIYKLKHPKLSTTLYVLGTTHIYPISRMAAHINEIIQKADVVCLERASENSSDYVPNFEHAQWAIDMAHLLLTTPNDSKDFLKKFPKHLYDFLKEQLEQILPAALKIEDCSMAIVCFSYNSFSYN